MAAFFCLRFSLGQEKKREPRPQPHIESNYVKSVPFIPNGDVTHSTAMPWHCTAYRHVKTVHRVAAAEIEQV